MARKIVLWPVYFDANKSRGEGRKVPLHLAVKGVTADLVLKAAKAAGYMAELDPDAKHPATWFESSGRVFVYSDEPKTVILKRVAEQLRKLSLQLRRSS